MTMSICVSLLISMSSSLLFAESPLTLGVWLILMTLVISIFSSTLASKWFGLILFLVYVGGLLVMFAYFSAISPNQLNDIKTMLTTFLVSVTVLIPIVSTLYPKSSSLILWSYKTSIQSSILTLENFTPLLSAALVLFLAMVVVIKIAPNHQGPLRPFSCCYHNYCFENNK